jgi:hypothetical protein
MKPVTVVLIVAVFGLVLWCAGSCLADLARTPDEQLRMFPRMAWALLIVLTVPLGGVLYLMYGKGPRRYV